MHVAQVCSLEEIDRLSRDWDDLYRQDRHATVFSSFAWLRGWFDVSPFAYSVLAVRDDGGRCVGLLPISVRGATHALRIDQVREVCMAGDPAADYSGFLAVEQHEDAVLQALAKSLANDIEWDRMRLREIRDPRIDRFADYLAGHSIIVERSNGICCPHIPLPGTWEEFERSQLKPETRRSLRKRMRDVQQQCRVITSEDQVGESDIDTLMRLAALRRPDNADLAKTRRLFETCAAANMVSITTIWHGEEPVASQGSFIDRKHNAVRVYLSGFDDRYAKLSPGRVLDAYCIRHAIEQGLTDYDFLRGDEAYKFQFGAGPRLNRTLMAVRQTMGTATRLAVSRMRETLRI